MSKSYMVYAINLQPYQLIYNRHVRGQLADTSYYYRYVMASFGVDASDVTATEVDQQILALVWSPPGGGYAVALDTDNDEDFSNETVFLFPALDSTEQLKPFPLPVQQVQYEYFDGKKIQTRQEFVQFTPYMGRLRTMTDNPLLKKYFLGYMIPLHRQGVVFLDGKKYRIAISNGFLQGDYFNTQRWQNAAQMIIWDADSVVKSQADGGISYRVGEVFTLDGYRQYRLDHIDRQGTRATLTFVGETDRPEGYTDNFFAPGFTGLTLAEDTISIENFRGSYVLLDFWGTWCAPCIEGIPDLKKIHAEYAPKGLQMVGIAAQESSREAVKEFVEKRKMPWMHTYELLSRNHDPALHSPQTATHRYKIVSYPTFILIDPDGRVVLRTSRMIEVEEFLKRIPL